jgi:hypothetical protein
VLPFFTFVVQPTNGPETPGSVTASVPASAVDAPNDLERLATRRAARAHEL